MRINRLKYKKYCFPLSSPLQISNQIITKKESIIIEAEDQNGNVHYGEVSPLLGFSKESLEDCETKLIEIIGNKISSNINSLNQELANLPQLPALLFGLEQIIFSVNENKFFNDNEVKSLKTNGLVGIKSIDETLDHVEKLNKIGFDTIKLKIGRSNFQEDYVIIKKLDKIFSRKIKLRLDNNSGWELSEAKEYIEELSEFNIEYIEQPVESTKELLALANSSKIKIAVDESLNNYQEALHFIESGAIDFFVLKPTIRIGLNESIRIIELANSEGINIIISSAFETAIGRNILLYLASQVNHALAHGLNTELIGSNIIGSEFNYTSPKIDFKNSKLFNSVYLG